MILVCVRNTENRLLSRLLRKHKNLEWFHTEIVLENISLFGVPQNFVISSWDTGGVHFRLWEQEKRKHINGFEAYRVGGNDLAVYERANNEVGKPYNFIGLPAALSRVWPISGHGYYCSEYNYDLMVNTGGVKLPSLVPTQVSPEKLREVVRNQGYPLVQI